MNARRKGNPTASPWYSTPNDARGRKRIELTLAPEELDALDVLAEAGAASKSAVVGALIREESARRRRRAAR